jgi:hypothetical protein
MHTVVVDRRQSYQEERAADERLRPSSAAEDLVGTQ